MTDVIGNMGKIVEAKPGDAFFLFVTDSLTWRQRRSDLRRIVSDQDEGDIFRICTFAMLRELEDDLTTLKQENGL